MHPSVNSVNYKAKLMLKRVLKGGKGVGGGVGTNPSQFLA